MSVEEIVDEWVNGEFRASNLQYWIIKGRYQSLWFLLMFANLAEYRSITWEQLKECDRAASGHSDYSRKLKIYLDEVKNNGKLSWDSKFL